MYMTVNNLMTCVFLLFFLNVHSKEQYVILEWKFKGIEEGYDHVNRSKVSVDGEEMPVSKSFHQSEWGSYQLKLSKKAHKIRLVNEAYCNGKWTEHTFENQFSINAICEFELNAKEVSKVQIEFNLDGGNVSITRFDRNGAELVKKKAVFKGRHYPMKIDWSFIHVEEGYDHLSRMLVFVDDIEYGISPQSQESKGGMFMVKIPKGSHRIRIVNQSFLNGVWQDHTIVNNYSVEAVYEKSLEIRKSIRVTLIIDLNDEHTVNTWE
jgi:hypothetical protein